MCEPTFEEWFFSFAAVLERLNGQQVDFEGAYNTYQDGVCGGVCARMAAGAGTDALAMEAWA